MVCPIGGRQHVIMLLFIQGHDEIHSLARSVVKFIGANNSKSSRCHGFYNHRGAGSLFISNQILG